MSRPHRNRNLVSLTAPGSFAAEQYHGLRLTVERLARARSAQVIAVTSPGAGEGKTITAINLAASLTRGSEARVLLIDADLRRPSVSRHLGLADAGAPGLANVLADDARNLDHVTYAIDGSTVALIPAGTSREPVHRVLRQPNLDEVLKRARQRYDFVVMDTPPVLPVFDAAMLARAADAVLVVVAARHTPRKLLGEALNLLDGSKLLGIVFNRDERPLFGYYNAYYRDYFAGGTGVGA
jgi:capsular exopolysaccharide synthesis family protein